MTASRPDLLPFAMPTRIGLPYHGIVRNGALELPTTETRTWVTGSIGWSVASRLVRHSAAVVPEPDPTNPQRNWQNYALLSGSERYIGAAPLYSEIPAVGERDCWLYCDSDRTWLVYWRVLGTSALFTVTVFLRQLFGVLGQAVESMSEEIVLASETFSAVRYTGAASPNPGFQLFCVGSCSQDGAICVVNVGSYGSNGFGFNAGQIWPQTTASLYECGVSYTRGANPVPSAHFHNVIKITLSGNGNTSGAVGSGISAVIESHLTAQEMAVTTTPDYTYPNDNEYIVLCAAQNNGTIADVKWRLLTQISYSIGDTDPLGFPCTITTTTQDGYVSFADHVIPYSALMSVQTCSIGYATLLGGHIMDVAMTPKLQADVTIDFAKTVYLLSVATCDHIVIAIGGQANNADARVDHAVSKQGSSLLATKYYSPEMYDIAYDGGQETLTAGAPGDRLVYV